MHRTWLQSISFSIFLLQWNHVRALQRQNALLHMKPVTFTGHRQVLHSKSCFSSATLLSSVEITCVIWVQPAGLSICVALHLSSSSGIFRKHFICRSCLKHLIAAMHLYCHIVHPDALCLTFSIAVPPPNCTLQRDMKKTWQLLPGPCLRHFVFRLKILTSSHSLEMVVNPLVCNQIK